MSIATEAELTGMKQVSYAVAYTLQKMKEYTQPGISTKDLDDYGAGILAELGAKSAPMLTYGFPGYTCISVNHEFCHGIPSADCILQEGDLVNIDVSAELNGFWADNGSSFIVGEDLYGHLHLVQVSEHILLKAIDHIRGGVKINAIGELIETEAKKQGYKVIRNLGGHGIGRSLHEQPDELLNYKNRFDNRRFRKNSIVAIETFISTDSTYADTMKDGWTMTGNKGGYMAQHEHTLLITDKKPLILTKINGIL